MIASVALAAYGDRIGGGSPEFMPRDPGAIRASGGGPTANWIDFKHEEDAPAYAEGRVFWDKDNECLAFYPDNQQLVALFAACFISTEEPYMRHNLLLLAALLIVAAAAFSDTPNFSPRDPGAARKDASNITAATWRTALDVYSKGEMDATLGSISAALDEIIGAP